MSVDKETLREVAQVLFKKSVEFDEGQDPMAVLTELHKQHSDVLKAAGEDKYNHGFKNGAIELEKKLRTSFDVEDKLEGEALINLIKENFTAAGASTEEIEKIRNDYKAKLEAVQKQNADSVGEYKDKYENLMKELAVKEAAAKFNNAIAPYLADPNLNLSDDTAVNAIKIDAFKTALRSKYNLSFTESGVQVLGEDGTPLLDSMNRVVTFDEVAKSLASALIGYKNGKQSPTFKSSETQTIEELKKWLDENAKLSETEEYQKKRSAYVNLLRTT